MRGFWAVKEWDGKDCGLRHPIRERLRRRKGRQSEGEATKRELEVKFSFKTCKLLKPRYVDKYELKMYELVCQCIVLLQRQFKRELWLLMIFLAFPPYGWLGAKYYQLKFGIAIRDLSETLDLLSHVCFSWKNTNGIRGFLQSSDQGLGQLFNQMILSMFPISFQERGGLFLCGLVGVLSSTAKFLKNSFWVEISEFTNSRGSARKKASIRSWWYTCFVFLVLLSRSHWMTNCGLPRPCWSDTRGSGLRLSRKKHQCEHRGGKSRH